MTRRTSLVRRSIDLRPAAPLQPGSLVSADLAELVVPRLPLARLRLA